MASVLARVTLVTQGWRANSQRVLATTLHTPIISTPLLATRVAGKVAMPAFAMTERGNRLMAMAAYAINRWTSHTKKHFNCGVAYTVEIGTNLKQYKKMR